MLTIKKHYTYQNFAILDSDNRPPVVSVLDTYGAFIHNHVKDFYFATCAYICKCLCGGDRSIISTDRRNDSTDQKLFLCKCGHLTDLYGTHVMMLHHFRSQQCVLGKGKFMLQLLMSRGCWLPLPSSYLLDNKSGSLSMGSCLAQSGQGAAFKTT